jgi:menaquinone-dependent protoporphyrinogen oxidase
LAIHANDQVEQQAHPANRSSVLVVYASRYGSTRGIAELIANRLRETDYHIDLRSVEQVDDLTPYEAVVLGSAVFNQRWIPEAEALVRSNLAEFADRSVWLFSVGTFGDRKAVIGPSMRREPKGIREIEEAIHPRDYRVFAGVIDRHRWPFLSRLLYHALGGRLGDNRDWPDIDRWADGIASALPTLVTR